MGDTTVTAEATSTAGSSSAQYEVYVYADLGYGGGNITQDGDVTVTAIGSFASFYANASGGDFVANGDTLIRAEDVAYGGGAGAIYSVDADLEGGYGGNVTFNGSLMVSATGGDSGYSYSSIDVEADGGSALFNAAVTAATGNESVNTQVGIYAVDMAAGNGLITANSISVDTAYGGEVDVDLVTRAAEIFVTDAGDLFIDNFAEKGPVTLDVNSVAGGINFETGGDLFVNLSSPVNITGEDVFIGAVGHLDIQNASLTATSIFDGDDQIGGTVDIGAES